MAYKKFQASRLFTGCELLSGDHVLVTQEDGRIEAVLASAEAGDDVQKFEGILSPGLVNTHCHLELSHLKSVIPPGTGLVEFLCSVVTKRNFDPQFVQEDIARAEKEMYDNGIVAVGDIGNTADTAPVKSGSKILWQNFVEVLGFTDAKARENIAHYSQVLHALEAGMQSSLTPHRSSLVPHAPYSISPETFRLLNNLTEAEVISIHNQEHPAEDELYKTGGGDYLKLFQIFGVSQSPFPVTGKSSIRSYLPHFNKGQTILLVHNTYMPEEDILFANDYANTYGLQLVYCLCPGANLYIENTLPPVHLFLKHNCQLALGTDSYSSNWELSMAREIRALVTMNSTAATLAQALQWATLGGARALRWDDKLGSFEKGKKPGVCVLENDLSSSRRAL